MVSSALRHFPPVLFHEGERVLWNLVQRKPLANRPEERVRLRYLDFLLLDLKWPRTRIAIESTLAPVSGSERFRADLVCYTREMKPSVLIECKADTVRLNESAALQIARYNRSLMAPHLCITNGLNDYWFEIIDGRPVARPGPDYLYESLPDLKSVRDNSGRPPSGEPAGVGQDFAVADWQSEWTDRPTDYWQMRGFVGTHASDELSDKMETLLNRFWGEMKQPSETYLSFQIGFRDIPFDHYYRIFSVPGPGQLAVTFTGTPGGETCLVAFLNIERANKGYLIVHLDKLLSDQAGSGILVSRGETRQVDVGETLFSAAAIQAGPFIDNLPLNLYDLFQEIL